MKNLLMTKSIEDIDFVINRVNIFNVTLNRHCDNYEGRNVMISIIMNYNV